MKNEMSAKLHPTQVHIQTCIPSHYSCIDCSHEFIGSALVWFERSTLPEHEGARTVVFRFLKIITPVKCVIPLYDGHISYPKEGELHRRRRKSVVCQYWQIETNRKVLIVSCQVFNYFGMYNYWHIYPSIWHRSYYIMDPRVFNENGDRGI